MHFVKVVNEFGVIGKVVKPLVRLCKNLNFFESRQDVLVVVLGHICDMIKGKGNESLVVNSDFYFLTPLSQNIKMLNFDVNPITIGYLFTEL